MATSMNAAIPHLLRTVELEIEAVRRGDGDGSAKASLTRGESVGPFDSAGPDGTARHEYRYQCRTWPPELDAAELMVRPATGGGPWTAAEITLAPDGRRRVVTGAQLGSSPPNLQVREDDTATWETLADRLRATAKQGAVEPEAARWILGAGQPKTGTEARPERYVRDWPGLRLNAEQRSAVCRALGSDVLFLWGPPGTGKTDVVSHIIEGCYRQGHTVLFLAPTKVAVDQALQRVCRLLEGEEGFAAGLVQRSGEITLPALRADYGDRILEEEIAARLSAELRRDTDAVAARRAEVGGQLARRMRVEALVREHGDTVQISRGEQQAHATALGTAASAQQKCAQLADEVQRLGAGFALRKQSRLEKLDADLAEARWVLVQQQALAQSAASRLSAAARRIAEIEQTLRASECDVAALPSINALQYESQVLDARSKELGEQLRKVADVVRARCRVKGATVAKAIVSPKLLDRVDVVVIDEAGMVNLPSAWYAAGLAGRRVVLAGDFRQLPAVTKSAEDRDASGQDQSHAARWMARDAFHAAGLADQGRVQLRDPRLVALRTQYRMRQPICDLVNTVAYPDSPLHTARADTAELAELSGLLDSPLILVDTSTHRIAHPQRKGAHLSNEVHEAVIHEIVRALQYDQVLPARRAEPGPRGTAAADRLGVISPYRAQAKILAASLKHRFGQGLDGLADTVHRFQGSEASIVIFDTVAGAGRTPGQFYAGTDLSSTTCRLLNVGLSRARDHLIVIADVAYLRKNVPPGPTLAMLDHLEQHAFTWPIERLVPIREAAELGHLSAEELSRPAFFPADEVDRAVAWDLAHAQRSIEIFCAFFAKTAMDRWLPQLGRRVTEGVAVTVYTRPIEDEKGQAHVERLRSAGCAVQFRERMHEKVLILDDDVLWHGSLNLLGHTGSRDLMMRLTDSSACGRVRRILEHAREDRPAWRPAGVGTPGTGTSATAAARDSIGPGSVRDGRLYLLVPYEQKDEAKKSAQARWDGPRKLWHVDAARYADPASPDHQTIRRWLP